MRVKQIWTVGLAVAIMAVFLTPSPASAQGVMFVTGNQVGVGTDTPTEKLHVKDGNLKVEQTGAAVSAVLDFATAAANWEIKQNGTTGRLTFFSPGGGATTASFKFDRVATENLLRVGVLAPSTVDINGNLVITGTCTGCDAVFQPDWNVEPIEAHADAMYANKYLPAVGPTPEGPVAINVFEKTTGILQELEKAHIYIAQLNSSLKELQAEVELLKQQR